MSLASWKGLTASQLAEITDNVTFTNKSYWEAHAYTQIKDLISASLSNFVNVKDYGATGDGATDDYTAISNADSAAGASTGAGILWFPKGTYKIGTNITFSTGSLVCFASGAVLSVNSGVAVTISRMGFAPPNEQIFTGSGTAAMATGAARIAFAEWWGGASVAISRVSFCLLLDNGMPVLPNITTSQRDSLSSPQNGMMLYNTTTKTFQVREDGLWKNIVTSL